MGKWLVQVKARGSTRIQVSWLHRATPTLKTTVVIFLVKILSCGACSIPTVGLPLLRVLGTGNNEFLGYLFSAWLGLLSIFLSNLGTLPIHFLALLFAFSH